MIRKNIAEFHERNKNYQTRDLFEQILDYCQTDNQKEQQLLSLCGVSNTGSTTLAEQVAECLSPDRCVFFQVESTDWSQDVTIAALDALAEGKDTVFFDEITASRDFINGSEAFPIIFLPKGMHIVLTGHDCYGFLRAMDDRQSLGRYEICLRMTLMPFAEYHRLTGRDLAFYIQFGGVLGSNGGEPIVHDQESAIEYIKTAIADNVFNSYSKDDGLSERQEALTRFTREEFQNIVTATMWYCAGAIKMKRTDLKNALEHLEITAGEDDTGDRYDGDKYALPLAQKINSFCDLPEAFTEKDATTLKDVLYSLDVIAPLRIDLFTFENGEWQIGCQSSRELQIVQPALRFQYLREMANDFAEDPDLFDKVNKLIMHDMIIQTVIFDITKDLANEGYRVSETIFRDMDNETEEHALVVKECEGPSYWFFLFGLDEPKIETALSNMNLIAVADCEYGDCEEEYVLHQGETTIDPNGDIFLNIEEFLIAVHERKGKSFEEVLEELCQTANRHSRGGEADGRA